MTDERVMSEEDFLTVLGLTTRLFPLLTPEDTYIFNTLYDPTLEQRKDEFHKKTTEVMRRLGEVVDNEALYREIWEELPKYPHSNVEKSFAQICQGLPPTIEESFLIRRLESWVDVGVVRQKDDNYSLPVLFNALTDTYRLIKNYLVSNGKPECMPQNRYDYLVEMLEPLQ